MYSICCSISNINFSFNKTSLCWCFYPYEFQPALLMLVFQDGAAYCSHGNLRIFIKIYCGEYGKHIPGGNSLFLILLGLNTKRHKNCNVLARLLFHEACNIISIFINMWSSSTLNTCLFQNLILMLGTWPRSPLIIIETSLHSLLN